MIEGWAGATAVSSIKVTMVCLVSPCTVELRRGPEGCAQWQRSVRAMLGGPTETTCWWRECHTPPSTTACGEFSEHHFRAIGGASVECPAGAMPRTGGECPTVGATARFRH